ncbi:MAG: HD domain-containing protein [Deltaproteobacteria bacterium]|nr:HD domain-containing protein [Deltaproteobacteria bacterium]
MIREAVERLLSAREAAIRDLASGVAGGVRTAAALADAADACVAPVLAAAGGRELGWSIWAVGSTGRRELSIGSDLDYVLAWRGREPAARVAAASELARALWDAHVPASIAAWDVADVASLAEKDDTILATLLDRRRVAGDPSFGPDPDPRPAAGVRARVARFATFLAAQDRERRLDPGLDLFAAEPDLKAGMGGLRDLASISWLARAARWPGAAPRSQAAARRLAAAVRFAETRSSAAASAREVILGARHLVGLVIGPRRDRLTREALARIEEAGKASAALPRRLEVARIEVAVQRAALLGPLLEPRSRPEPALGAGSTRSGTLAHPPDPAALAADATALLSFVAAAARRGLHPGPEVAAAARECRHSVRPSPSAGQALLDLLGSPGTPTAVGWLVESGILADLLPAFRRLVGLVPGDEVHAFTVGRHSTLVASALADLLDGFAVPRGCAPAVASGAAMRTVLLLSALLHDLGKSKGPPHEETGAAEAAEAARRLGLAQEDAARVGDLCRLHMLLPRASVTRDCDDPSVIRSLAAEVGSVDRADALLLLAIADQRSLGSGASIAFRETLLVRAWRNVRDAIAGGVGPGTAERDVAVRRAGIADAAEAAGLPPAVVDIARDLPPRYLASFDDAEAADHLALVAESLVRSPAVRFRPAGDDGTYEAAYAGRDDLGLLARISGALFLMGLSILEARIFSLPGGAVLDLFRVSDPGRRTLPTGEARSAAAARLAADAADPDVGVRARKRLAARRALVADVDNTASDRYTAIRVGGPDAPGLLWRVADALYRQGLDVGGAIVTTVAGEARDTFFVEWGAGGGKLSDPEAIRRVLRAISGA